MWFAGKEIYICTYPSIPVKCDSPGVDIALLVPPPYLEESDGINDYKYCMQL